MTATLSASGYATPHSAASFSFSSSLPPTSKMPSKPKPVNVFTNDGSFLERFQRSKQGEDDRLKAEEALTIKKQFADRFKNRGKRPPPPDSSPAVTSIDVVLASAKRPKLGDVSQNPQYKKEVGDARRVYNRPGTGVGPSVK